MLELGPKLAPILFDSLSGSVKDASGNPLERRLRALHHHSARRYSAISDPQTGAWAINNIEPGLYYVVTEDHTREFQGQVATFVRAVPME